MTASFCITKQPPRTKNNTRNRIHAPCKSLSLDARRESLKLSQSRCKLEVSSEWTDRQQQPLHPPKAGYHVPNDPWSLERQIFRLATIEPAVSAPSELVSLVAQVAPPNTPSNSPSRLGPLSRPALWTSVPKQKPYCNFCQSASV